LFLSHTNSVYGALHCDPLLWKDNNASEKELNEILFHGGDYKEFGLGCDAMKFSKIYGRCMEDISVYLAARSISFPRNIGRLLLDYTASHPRRRQNSSS